MSRQTAVEVFLPEQAAGGGQRATRIRLNRLGPGRCLGEYGVIDDQASSASASAVMPSRLGFLPKAEFRKLVERHDRTRSSTSFSFSTTSADAQSAMAWRTRDLKTRL
jgi:CRP-like cAMP-binding protein